MPFSRLDAWGGRVAIASRVDPRRRRGDRRRRDPRDLSLATPPQSARSIHGLEGAVTDRTKGVIVARPYRGSGGGGSERSARGFPPSPIPSWALPESVCHEEGVWPSRVCVGVWLAIGGPALRVGRENRGLTYREDLGGVAYRDLPGNPGGLRRPQTRRRRPKRAEPPTKARWRRPRRRMKGRSASE